MWVNELLDVSSHVDILLGVATALQENSIFKDIGAINVYGGGKSFSLCRDQILIEYFSPTNPSSLYVRSTQYCLLKILYVHLGICGMKTVFNQFVPRTANAAVRRASFKL